MTVITLIIGKVPIRLYLKLLLIPVVFLISSILVILLNFSTNPIEGAIFQSIIGPVTISISITSVEMALFEMQQIARGDEFKAISKIIK